MILWAEFRWEAKPPGGSRRIGRIPRIGASFVHHWSEYIIDGGTVPTIESYRRRSMRIRMPDVIDAYIQASIVRDTDRLWRVFHVTHRS